MALLMAYIIFRTPVGLAIRMTGENPHAAEAQGVNPMKVRYGAVIAGSALMGMGGAFLTLSAFNSFFPTMVQGRGWICIALVVFASWRPGRALFGALLFAFFDAFQLRLQTALSGRRALSALSDDALYPLHRGSRRDGPPRPRAAGADAALSPGRTLIAILLHEAFRCSI
jgi:ABC-type uncharacterized transport system permease subunit